MKVQELMTPEPRTCRDTVNLLEITKLMWDRDCGIVPLVDENGDAVGVITDRDVCMAVGTRNQLASDIHANEVATGKIYSCHPEDEVQAALAIMKDRQVRRLLVTDDDGRIVGIVSLNDLTLATGRRAGKQGVSHEAVLDTLRAICEHRVPTFA